MKQCLSVMRWQFGTWLGSARTITAFLVCAAASLLDSVNLMQFARASGDPLNIFEPFIYNSSTLHIATLMFLGLMLLFADAPFTEQSAMYSLVRCSRVQWVVGKLMYILLSCAVYYIFSLAVTVLFFSPNAFAGNVWSAPFYELVMRDAAASSYHITVDPKLFMPVVTPYLSAFYALVLNLGYGFFCGLLLFLINLSGSRVLGFAVLSAQHIISYLIRFKYLPFFISVFSNHGFSEDAGLPSVGFSCAYFCLLAAIIVACILRAVRHVDLKITVGTRI